MNAANSMFGARWFVVVACGVIAFGVACAGRTDLSTATCGPNEIQCGDDCAAVSKDPANCGSCGVVCAQGTVCFEGACATSCGGGTSPCGQSCVDPQTDHDNCGGCGVACASGEACVAGACTSTCGDKQTLCGGKKAYCANTDSDNENCGGCAVSCGKIAECIGGTCDSFCTTTQTLCPPTQTTSAFCTDLSSDPNDCGVCGHSCGANAYCSENNCACVTGATICNSFCVDTQTDLLNCGSCGATCSGTCANGRCTVTLVSSPGTYGQIAVDGTNVYYGSGSAVSQVPKVGGTAVQLASAYYPDQIVVDAANVYWINNLSSQLVQSVPIGGGATTTLIDDSPGSGVTVIATDGAYLYFGDAGPGSIWRIPVGGGTAENIHLVGFPIRALVRDGATLVWSDFGTIEQDTTAGSYLIGVPNVQANFIGVHQGTVFGSEGWGAGIFSAPLSVFSQPTLLASNQHAVAFATDDVSVYWLESTTSGYELRRVPQSGGSVVTLVTGIALPSGIAVDATSVYWNSQNVMKLTPK